jgi:plastocyanin
VTRFARHFVWAVAMGAAVFGATEVAGARRERAPARLLVSADELSLMLSRQTIKSGAAVIQFHNRGEDPHDLRMRRLPRRGVSARRTFAVRETPSGDLEELEWRLPSGRYRLWCSLPGHEQAGMRAKLRVRRAR